MRYDVVGPYFVPLASGTTPPPTGNAAPSLALTSPSNNATFAAGTTSVTLNAAASDRDGSVSSVKFYRGSALIASDTAAPYTATLSGLSAGAYTVRAVATDNQGATAEQSITFTIAGTPPPAGGSCQVTYTVANQWNNGASINLTVKNTGTAPVNGWTLTFAFPGDQQLADAWSSTATQSGKNVTIRNVDYNASIAPGASVGLGFNLSYSGSNAKPALLSLNGKACQ